MENLGIARIRSEILGMEEAAHAYYVKAAQRVTDADTRRLLSELASAEAGHMKLSETLTEKHLPESVRSEEDAVAHRQFVLTWVQPGLAG